MSALVAWLLSIFAMIIVSVVVELFIASSRVSRIVKSVCSIITVFVVTAPLPTLIKSGFKLDEIGSLEYTPVLDEGYLEYISARKLKVLAESIESELNEKFCGDISVSIVGGGGDEVSIEKVYLNFNGSGINGANENINRNEVAEYVVERLSVEADKVIVYG